MPNDQDKAKFCGPKCIEVPIHWAEITGMFSSYSDFALREIEDHFIISRNLISVLDDPFREIYFS